MKKILDARKHKRRTEDQELIRGILGRNKFLMLNLNLVKALRPDGACYLTFLLDKAEYLLSIGEINTLNEGFWCFRREIENKIGLNAYYQRKIEDHLTSAGLISITEKRELGETWNEYIINIAEIFLLVEPENVEHPLKTLHPPPVKFAPWYLY